MSLWVDKYRPTALSKLDYHKDQSVLLKRLVNHGDFPHLLVYGPSGAGKKTRVMALLRELYGSGVEKLINRPYSFVTPSKKKLDIMTISSNYHIEVNPSDVGVQDRVVIQELIKSIAEVNQLDINSQRDFKVVVLTEVDRLTKDAQHALRRTMEKYMVTCRIILICNSSSKVIPAIKSRCLGIRVPAPSIDEICQVLQMVCKKEGLTLPIELAKKISLISERNLRRALLMCEACKVQQYPFSVDQEVTEPDWKLYLQETAVLMVQQQSPQRLLEIRARLYELLTHCIPPDIIMKICQVLQMVCKKEGLTLPIELAKKISLISERNLRRALLMCEACKVQQYPFSVDQEVTEPDWKLYLQETAVLMVQQQSPQRLLEIRARLYELLTHCIPPDIIMKGLLQELITNCDGQLKAEVVKSAAYYEHRLQLGQKAIFHLEAFVAKFMAIYKRFIEEGIAELF